MLKLIHKRFLMLSAFCLALAFIILATKTFAPNHRLIAIVFFGLSCASLIVSVQRRKALIRKNRTAVKGFFKGYGLHLIVAVCLILFVYCARVLTPFTASPLSGLSPAELANELTADVSTTLYIQDKLAEQTASFIKEVNAIDPDAVLMDEDRAQLLSRWYDWLSTLIETDILKKKYAGFYQIDYLSQPENHAQAFWISYGNLCHQYLNVYQLQKACMTKKQLGLLLNEAISHLNNESDILYYLQQQLTDNKNLLRLSAGRAYAKLVDKDLKGLPLLHSQIDEAQKAIDAGLVNASALIIQNPLAKIEKMAQDNFFPIQKQIAVNMSFIRVSDKPYAIQPDDLKPHIATLQPGDILLERRNWHITNAGIPGFWPHTALYTGSLNELDTFFESLPVLKGRSFSEMLKEHYPDIYSGYQRIDEQGHEMRVLEAKRPGVVFFSLEDSANCDYMAALRTQCTKEELYRVLLNAYTHYKKPYDFNFDFATEDAMVCSEFVYKAYQATGKLPIPLEQVNGRGLIPPNSFAKFYDENPGLLTPVLFLEGAGRGVSVSELSAIKDSWKRPKWSFMQN